MTEDDKLTINPVRVRHAQHKIDRARMYEEANNIMWNAGVEAAAQVADRACERITATEIRRLKK